MPKNIVLLGIGHTHAYIVKKWVDTPIPDCMLTCISTYPTATYSGMLPGTLGEQFSDDEMRIDLRALANQAGADLILADTSGLDLKARRLHFSNRDPIAFDLLSIGVGSMPAGWQQHADSPLMVSIKPMQTFLRRLDEKLNATTLARVDETINPRSLDSIRLTAPARKKVAVVGGGVAGVEIACCLQLRLRKRKLEHAMAIEIFTNGNRIADGMSDRSIRRIEKLLADRRIAVHYGRRVTGVGETSITTQDGEVHQVDCVIWATGAAAPPVLDSFGLQKDNRGFVSTRDTLQSVTDPSIFAVGDCGTMIDTPSPKAGVYAVRQCPILWHNLRASVVGGPMSRFSPQRDFLKILNTGDGQALLQYRCFTAHARWCWKLKTWIDQRFVGQFQVPNPDPR